MNAGRQRCCVALAVAIGACWLAGHARADAPSIRLLDADNRALDPARDFLGVARAVTNDGSLPRDLGFDGTSGDPEDVRLEVVDPAAQGESVWATIESVAATNGARRSELRVELRRAGDARNRHAFRSRFVRLVGDEIDLHAARAEAQTLLVALRDGIQLRYEHANGEVLQTFRVGAAAGASDARAARLVRLHVHVLEHERGGVPVAGGDTSGALQLLREQVRVANQIWLQCHVTFGEPSELPIEIVAPPPAGLVVVGDEDGLPARGGGRITLAVDGMAIAPLATRAGAPPLETARALARAIDARGFSASVTPNARTRFGADASADVLVRRRDGTLASVTSAPGVPLATDARQRVAIVAVDLSDGLTEFDNMNAQAGSAEERALVKALADDDPRTVDLFIVNRFSGATRQGEAFIESSRALGASIVNTVILDRQGLRHLPLAWTLAHEIGHVLLDDPLHPDNVGPDRPWLLMDADNSRGTVNGPKRLRAEDCARMRKRSAALLVPYEPGSEQ